jgi:hypothetical protein
MEGEPGPPGAARVASVLRVGRLTMEGEPGPPGAARVATSSQWAYLPSVTLGGISIDGPGADRRGPAIGDRRRPIVESGYRLGRKIDAKSQAGCVWRG